MGNPLLKPAMNFTSLPLTSVAVTGNVLVRIMGAAHNFSSPEFNITPNTVTSRHASLAHLCQYGLQLYIVEV